MLVRRLIAPCACVADVRYRIRIQCTWTYMNSICIFLCIQALPVCTEYGYDVQMSDGYNEYLYQSDHVIRVLDLHPRYLHAFQVMRQLLLQGDGPLPYDQRHYIAIMVGLHGTFCCLF